MELGRNELVKVAVSGFASDTGKTSLLCDLLRALPGWEAIKITRGHYRSCGKDPHTCCVAHLLSDQPLIRSGREATYELGKDTGRYWEAGAANVHWVVVADAQVEAGINLALQRVHAPGVLIEGTSFLRSTPVDYRIMVARPNGGKIKSSARRALPESSALYLFEPDQPAEAVREQFAAWSETVPEREILGRLPIYTGESLSLLLDQIEKLIPSVVQAV